jgi:hypothetical protein
MTLIFSVLAAFPGPGWGKLSGEIHLDLKGLTSHQVRCKSAVFRQTGRYLCVFSTRTENRHYMGFSGIGWNIQKGKGA